MYDKLEKIKKTTQTYNTNEYKTNYRATKIVESYLKLFQEVSEPKMELIKKNDKMINLFQHFYERFHDMMLVLKQNPDYAPPEIDMEGLCVLMIEIYNL